MEFLREEKTRKRLDALLEPIEDTLEAAINMKPLTQSTGPSMGGGTGGESALKSFVFILYEIRLF